MKYRILTESATYPFTSDYFKHLYPSNALYNTCKLILEENAELDIDNKSEELELYKNDINTFAGPLKKLPNDIDGAKRKDYLLKSIETHSRSNFLKENRIRNQSYWSNKSLPPSQNRFYRAPILPGTSLTAKTTTKAGIAAGIGIIVAKTSALLLYDMVRHNMNVFAKRIRSKNPHSIGAIINVTIIYLKVKGDYGRAPVLGRVTLEKLFNPSDDFDTRDFLTTKIKDICVPSYKNIPEARVINTIDELRNSDSAIFSLSRDQYETANLFIKCKW